MIPTWRHGCLVRFLNLEKVKDVEGHYNFKAKYLIESKNDGDNCLNLTSMVSLTSVSKPLFQ